MILAGIGHHYGWPRADLEGLTSTQATFWNNAAAELMQRAKQE